MCKKFNYKEISICFGKVDQNRKKRPMEYGKFETIPNYHLIDGFSKILGGVVKTPRMCKYQ